MIIRRQSILSGKVSEMDLDITPKQIQRFIDGEMVQDVFPHLTADEREFILTGITAEEWKSMKEDQE